MHYLNFYGLEEKPFELTPNPKYLYLSDDYRRAYEHLLFGIRGREGFVVITGEVGTGKTTLLRAVLNSLREEDCETAFVFNPSVSAQELLETVLDEFGLDTSGATTKKEMTDRLNQFLLDQLREGSHAVLLIDEAQNLAPEVLEEVRLLTNLETETQKLLQVVLVGQPELRDMLELPHLRQLNQRVAIRYHLTPLARDQVPGYVRHRLSIAGGGGQVDFTRGAIAAIHRYSGGVPRLINKACDKALLAGYAEGTRKIDRDVVREGIRTVEGEAPRKRFLMWGV